MGILLGGVPGVAAAKITSLGAGVSGSNARAAVGSGARRVRLDSRWMSERHRSGVWRAGRDGVLEPRRHRAARDFGRPRHRAVLLPGAAAQARIALDGEAMKRRVVVEHRDRPGGCFETSRPTTHGRSHLRGGRRGALLRDQHAGAVPRTSTYALNTPRCPSCSGSQQGPGSRRSR